MPSCQNATLALTIKALNKQTTKFMSAKIKKKILSKLHHNENFRNWTANSMDPVEVAHNEPPHLDLCCLPIQLFSYLQLYC